MNCIKKILFAGLFVSTAFVLKAQVKLNLTLLPDQRTYLVSMTPEVSWTEPMNMTGSAQIVVRLPAGKPFTAGNIKSLIPGVTWVDNAFVEMPASAPDYNFVCFVLNELGTKGIHYQAGIETPLFTFQNLEPECAGRLELSGNEDPVIEKVVQNDHINITQNLTVLGAYGNAFSGIGNNTADCAATSSTTTVNLVDELRVFPIPVADFLNIRWVNGAEANDMPGNLHVFNSLGSLISLNTLTKLSGEQNIRLDVSAWPTGLYSARFIADSGKIQSFKFLVSRT